MILLPPYPADHIPAVLCALHKVHEATLDPGYMK